MSTLIFVLITIATFFFLLNNILRRKINNLPPSPPGLPIIGNLHQLSPLPHRYVASLSKKYGPLILLRLGSIPTVFVSSAVIAEEVMKTQDIIFSTRPPMSVASRLFYGPRDVAFTPYGQYWRQVKKICVLHVLSNKKVQEFAPVRKEEVDLLLANITSASPAPVNLSNLLVTLSKDIISRAALGRKYSQKEFGEMVMELSALLGSFPLRDYIPWLGWVDEISGLNARVRRNFEQIDLFLERVLKEHIDRRKEAGEGVESQNCIDFVDVLLSLKEQMDDDLTSILDRESIKALILDVFSAGTETSSTLMEWVMTDLLNHPNSLQKVQEEIRKIVGNNGMVKEEDIDQMKYLKAIIKETLRFHPPGPLLIPREALQDTKLHGHNIPAGTQVYINVWTIARDPKYWKNPDEYQPERFLDSNIDYKGQDFFYLPFGSGRRVCPGISFALAAVFYALANLLYHFDWEIPEENRKETLDMNESSGMTARKKYDLILKAKPYCPSL